MTTWNSGDKSANISLSGGNLIATATSSAQGAVRATTSASSGKIYLEYTFTGGPSGINTAVGWANSTANLGSVIGVDANGVGNFSQSLSGIFYFNNTSLGTGSGPIITGYTICIAIDITSKLIWGRANGGFWNGSSTADPGAGAGGYSLAAIGAGPYFPVFCSNVSGNTVLANFGASSFGYTVPSGFAGLDSNVQNYNDSSKFLGYDLLGPPQTGVSSSKYLGFDVVAPPQNAVNSSKFLGYVILEPLTATPYSMGFVYG